MQEFFKELFGQAPSFIQKLSGGSINDVYEVHITRGEYVVKVNSDEKFPGMLAYEAIGLATLAESMTVTTPKVFECGCIHGQQFLVLEKIWTLDPDEKTWIQFAKELAKMHRASSTKFGFESDNYIGSLVQKNTPHQTWSEFLISQRLLPLLEMAVNQGDVNYVEAKIFDTLFTQLPNLYPTEPPALLHGDLWAGNFLIGPAKEPVLIDPAVYYGHREMDLAMMHLFGGFPKSFFNTYTDEYPLEKNWMQRMELSQLYPLLVHVNLFGRSYWSRIEEILKKYT